MLDSIDLKTEALRIIDTILESHRLHGTYLCSTIIDRKKSEEPIIKDLGDYLPFFLYFGYTNYCKELKGSPVIVEVAVTLASYGLPDIYGTADFVAEVGTTLHVVDLKAGISQVSAVDNGQLKIYALGAATAPRLLYYDKIVLTIVQPRVRPQISTEELSPFELVAWLENILKPAVAATKVEHPEANPSEKACQWCRAKPICKAYAERVTALAQQSFNNFAPKDLNSLTPAELGAILPHLGEIEKYLKALKAHSKSYMEQGG